MKLENIKKLIFSLCISLVTATVVITFLTSFMSFREEQFERDYVDFSKEWLTEDGNSVQLDKLDKSYRIYKTIPELESDTLLSFNARNVDVAVYIGDECLYETKRTDEPILSSFYGKTAGSDFVEVYIPQEYSGKMLSIDIHNPYSNTTSCKIVHMYLGNGVQIMKHNASVQLGPFCFSIIILFLGIVCLILYIPLKKNNIADRSMIYLGFMAFSFGMSMITDCKILQLIVGHETLYYTVSQLFMSMIPVPMLLFISELYGNLNKKVTSLLCFGDILMFILLFSLNCLGIADYHDMAFATLLAIMLSILYIAIITVKEFFMKVHKNFYHNIGIVFIVVAFALDVLMIRSDAFVETSFFTRFGIAGFICMECTQVLWEHIEKYQKGLKAQLVSHLAYHDGLTELLNRTSFMEDIEKLKNEEHDNILIGVFDVNGLKYVNDNFGHTDGDELIIKVANAITENFGSLGKCYRIGGDEFVLISECQNAESHFIKAQQKMAEELEKFSADSKYTVSVASGYSVMEDNHADIKDIFNDADEKMYANKKFMKEKKANLGAVL